MKFFVSLIFFICSLKSKEFGLKYGATQINSISLELKNSDSSFILWKDSITELTTTPTPVTSEFKKEQKEGGFYIKHK